MILWRISNHKTLDGRGGLFASARWHTRGQRIVYLASSPAGAMVETLVHLDLPENTLPESYQLLKIAVSDDCSRRRVSSKSLLRDWADDASCTQVIGDAWLQSVETALLEVPSAILPATSNWLLNPVHPDARAIRVSRTDNLLDDRRFFRFGG